MWYIGHGQASLFIGQELDKQTIELQISEDLAQRLAPYQDQLPVLLEAGLRLWREGLVAVPLQMPAALQARLHALLDQQKAGAPLTFEDRQEAEALAELAERVSLNNVLVQSQLPPLTLLTADANLFQAAWQEGLLVDNPNLHP